MSFNLAITSEKKKSIQLFFISLIFLSLFIKGHAVESISIIGFTGICVFLFFKKETDLSRDSFYWSWFLYYFILVVSGIWASDCVLFFEKIRIKSAMIALPFCFLVIPSLNEKQFIFISKFLTCLCILSLLYVGINFFLNKELFLKELLQGHPIPVPFRSHIRYSILLNFCLLISIYQMDCFRTLNLKKDCYLWASISLFLFSSIQFLAVKIGILISVLVILGFIFYKILSKKLYLKGLSLFVFLIISIFIISIYVPTVKNKLAYFRYDIERFYSNEHRNYSDGERIESILKGINVIKEHPWIGVGEGNVARFMGLENISNVKLPHNQFVISWAQNGVLGIISLCLIFLINIVKSIKTRNWMAMTYSLAMIMAFSVEPMLETQLGVAIFTLPMLLLYSIKKDIHT